jgi:dipeptidyl aminopeptidase/acylaminoacyl peptidase
MLTLLLALVLVPVSPIPGLCQESTEQAKSDWTVDDVINQERAFAFEISPDAKWVVWVKSRPDKEKDGFINDLYLTSLTEEREIRLTRSDDSDSSPRWRPDGRQIAFLSSRKGTGKEETKGSQLWLIDPSGGEPWQLTTREHGVNDFRWLDNERMLILTREDSYLYEQDLKKKKDDTIVVEDEEHFTPYRLFELKSESKKLKRLSDNDLPIRDFELSHNCRYAVAVAESSPHSPDPKAKPKYYLYDFQEGSAEELFPDPEFYPGGFTWALDDSGFYFSRTHTSDYYNSGPGARFAYWFDLKTKEYEQIPIEHDWGMGYNLEATADGFVAGLAAGHKFLFARYTRSGETWKKQLLQCEDIDHLNSISLAKDGKSALMVFSWGDKPSQPFFGVLEGATLKVMKQVVKLNKHLEKKKVAKYEVIRWRGALDEEVEGVLYYPHNYEEGKRYPLVLMIHGGPTGWDNIYFSESWAEYTNIVAGKGAFVLKPNYHGSGNYGQAFAESIGKGKYYELEVPDILNGVEHLIEKGLVDRDMLGVMGWSNGAILTIALVLERPDMFKVGAPGAGDVNWTSDYGNCSFGPTFDNYYFGGAPWEIPEVYIEKSPLFRAHEIKTPTIIFFGTNDTNVPTEQGWEFYRALQLIGKAPVRFLLFPGEPHGLSKLSHQRRKMEEEIAWLDKYLFAAYEKPNEALKEGSPLDVALKKRKVQVVGEFYGQLVNEEMVPELIKCGDVEAGRFEVTRAQWARFDSDFHLDAGTGNYPVTGINYEKALEYCRWLGEKTGASYRLPTLREIEKLLGKSKSDENTLDYWAGYTLNPDDADLLLTKVAELGDGPVLLRPVGEFKPAGEEALFDIGGNAAEWCWDEESGKPVVRGGCAALPTDERAGDKTPPEKYIGFRVIKDSK